MAEVTSYVAASADDAEQAGAAFQIGRIALILYSSDIGAWHFQSVSVPQGATIDSAILYLYPHPSYPTPSGTLYGDDADDSAQPAATTAELTTSDRDYTTASVSWSDTLGSGFQPTPDLKTIIQEIVDRGGWSSGNAMTILFVQTSGDSRWYTYDRNTSYAAYLTINYTEAAGGSAKIHTLGQGLQQGIRTGF